MQSAQNSSWHIVSAIYVVYHATLLSVLGNTPSPFLLKRQVMVVIPFGWYNACYQFSVLIKKEIGACYRKKAVQKYIMCQVKVP